MKELLVAKRTIYDAQHDVLGYYLHLHDPNAEHQSISEIPHGLLTDDLLAIFEAPEKFAPGENERFFISFSEQMLAQSIPRELSLKQLCININGFELILDDDIIVAITRLHGLGYCFSASGFYNREALLPILPFLSYFFVNTAASDPQELQQFVHSLKSDPLSIIASHVDAEDVFQVCQSLGFDYFEGYYLNLPTILAQDIVLDAQVIQKLLLALTQPDIAIIDVERIMSQDPRLFYRLLRMVRQETFAVSKKINSVREAIVLLGLKQIRSWVAMMAVSQHAEIPQDLINRTLIRAKMSEWIATYVGIEEASSYFTVGLFSTLPLLFNLPMASLLDNLNLTQEINDALLTGEGFAGDILTNVLAYEQGQWDELDDSGLPLSVWDEAYKTSVSWVARYVEQEKSSTST